MSDTVTFEGQVCRSNITPRGRRMRRRVSAGAAVVTAAVAGGLIAAGVAPWIVGLAVFVPAATSATSGLQVRRNTCVAHARTGTREKEGGGVERADEEAARVARAIASGITRDGALVGAGVAALAVVVSLVVGG